MNTTTVPALLRPVTGVVSLPCGSHGHPDALVDAKDFERLVSRGDLAFASMVPGRYFGMSGVPRLRYAPGRAPSDPNERVALPALVLRPRSGFRVAFVDPSRPYDCTRSNLKLAPVGESR